MTEKRCVITDLLVEQCSHCRTKIVSSPFMSVTGTDWYEARYGGRCGEYDGRFYEGDLISWSPDGGWIAECCKGEVLQ